MNLCSANVYSERQISSWLSESSYVVLQNCRRNTFKLLKSWLHQQYIQSNAQQEPDLRQWWRDLIGRCLISLDFNTNCITKAKGDLIYGMCGCVVVRYISVDQAFAQCLDSFVTIALCWSISVQTVCVPNKVVNVIHTDSESSEDPNPVKDILMVTQNFENTWIWGRV